METSLSSYSVSARYEFQSFSVFSFLLPFTSTYYFNSFLVYQEKFWLDLLSVHLLRFYVEHFLNMIPQLTKLFHFTPWRLHYHLIALQLGMNFSLCLCTAFCCHLRIPITLLPRSFSVQSLHLIFGCPHLLYFSTP